MHALILDKHAHAKLEALRLVAEANVVPFLAMVKAHQEYEASGRQRPEKAPNDDKTVLLRVGYSCTYTVEEHRPGVPCRHVSVSGPNRGPAPNAVSLLMQIMGFHNHLLDAKVWTEEVGDDRYAVNVLEPVRDEDWKELMMPVAGTVQ